MTPMASTVLSTSSPQSLAPAEFLDALRACASVLDQHAEALDRLDASVDWDPDDPVADEDRAAVRAAEVPGPGTDLAATLSAGCDRAGDGRDFSSLSRGLADGAAAAARTAAGQRLAGFLDGAGAALRNADRVDAARLALALEAGAERVTEGDDGTHPGCLLAVMSATADGALDASDAGSDLAEVLVSAAEAGLVELEQGPLVDARLSERGTVDAAAAGFLLVLDSLAAVVSGDPLPEPPQDGAVGEATRAAPSGQRFLIRCAVTAPAADIEAAADLEVLVHELSDLLVFDGTGRRWTVEATTAFPGAVVETLAGAGALSELHIGLAPE